MADVRKIAGLIKTLCVVLAFVLPGACARPPEEPAEPSQAPAQKPARSEVLSAFSARIPAVVTPPQRARQMSALADFLERLALELDRETRAYNHALARLMASPDTTREEFWSLRTGFEKKRRSLWQDLTDNLFTLKAMAARQEWQRLTTRDDQAPLFTSEDPRRLRETLSALEIRINKVLADSPLRNRAMTILKRAGREAAALDRQAALAEAQLSRLFVSYDARPESFRRGLERFASAQEAVFEELADVIFDLRGVLSPQQWQQLFA